MSVKPRDWDAVTYDRVSDPQVQWATAVLDRLALEGDETVLDAGCGSGRVTRLLAQRLPRGRVVAVDAAPSMVELAREAVGDRGEVILADLARLELSESVDAVFSNAVFHWLEDHDALFGAMFAALAPGGRLVAQCGGAGNVDAFHALALEVGREKRYAQHFEGWHGPWNFAGPQETAARLSATGFEAVETWLERRLIDLDDPLAYLSAVCLGPHLDRLPAELRCDYAERVTEMAQDARGHVALAYVRLNISARRPA